MCSWTEHEITSDYAELAIASQSPLLISGSVGRAPASVDKLLSALDAAGVNYKCQLFDENGCVIRLKREIPRQLEYISVGVMSVTHLHACRRTTQLRERRWPTDSKLTSFTL
ncbi:MAG: hypothetical protein KDB22_29670 [Planctomycetales bacterium]|nr:hypothetical protein [Planctomycetales bacterium]